MGVYRSSVPDYVVVGTVVLGRSHRSGGHWEFIGDFLSAFSFTAFYTISNCKLCHFCAICWPCTKFLAFTMNCLFITLPNCNL